MSLTQKIHETFRKAALQAEAARGLKPSDWKQYREIQNEHAERIRLQEKAYHAEYDTRFEAARAKLIAEAGKKGGYTLINKLIGRDTFNPAQIDRQAHRNVQADHYRSLERLEAEKNVRIDDALQRADQRQTLSREFKQQFDQAIDRRSGEDRRRSGPGR